MRAPRRFAGLWIGIAAAFCAHSASGQGWTTSGPDKVYALAVSPADGSVWAGTPTALYRSPDHGRSWLLVRSFPADATPMSIAFDQANMMYLALGRGGGVFRSTDGGATLVPLPVPNPCWWDVPAFAIPSSRPSTVYFNGCGLYRSADSGATWTSIPLLRNVRCLAADPTNPLRVVAGTQPNAEGGSVWLSEDGGTAWTAAALSFFGEAMDLQFDPTSPGRVLAAISGNYKAARSDDGGKSWADSSAGYTGNGPWALVIDPSDPRTVYLGSWPEYPVIETPPLPPPPVSGVQVSRDGGATWSVIPGTPTVVTMLAIDSSGDWLYAASYGSKGVSVYEAHPARGTVLPPASRRPPPRPIRRDSN